MIDFAQLTAPFPPERVSWRVGATSQDKKKGLALAYIDARDVMERLDKVVGPANWQSRYPHANGKTVCEIGLKIGDEWVWKADGAGDTDVEAEKGALSDAFKRAAVRWGIGRYLYDFESQWVEIEPAGKSYSIKQSEYKRLEKLIGGATPPKPIDVLPFDLLCSAVSEANSLEALAHVWKSHAADIKSLIEEDQASITAIKDKRKLELSKKEIA